MEITQTDIALWFHYEEIAMHFNQLLMQYRLQLMGGFGAIGALSGYLIGSKVDDKDSRHQLRSLISLGLLILVCAGASLDVFYYNELLQGSVDALLQFEESHPGFNMSTLIESRFNNRGTTIIYVVYALVLVPLTSFTVWSWFMRGKEAVGVRSDKNNC